MIRAVILAVGALYLSACAIAPQLVTVEADHVSHLTQHQPFTGHPTNFGFDSVSLIARWRRGRVYGEVSEGVVLEGKDGDCYGGLWGPREVFGARVGYVLWSRQ